MSTSFEAIDTQRGCRPRAPVTRGLRRPLALLVAIGAAFPACAPAFDITGPANSVTFGQQVAVLPNGNIVVTDPGYDSGVGAVYLYGPDGTQISVLTGSQAGDDVGIEVAVLANGNYVIVSPNWANGNAAAAGAVTWASQTSGVPGIVSASNSLVGTTAGDQIGGGAELAVLSNGNYVVSSPAWDNGSTIDAGAVTWGNGDGGTVGAVSAGNSLVGTTEGDMVGMAFALSNGNYVVLSQGWDNGTTVDAGAATWGNGNGGTVGPVSDSNSLVGTTAGDQVGTWVTVLTNGNYVVASPLWDDAMTVDAGAATWGNGNGGTTGTVSSANSLVGARANDQVDSNYFATAALSNGNYVVSTPSWNSATATQVGAATWGNGNGGTVGQVTSGNSLVGTTANDQVGSDPIAALANGNYVVDSAQWNNDTTTLAGAVTWGDGSSGTVGAVSAGNSLVGTTAGDRVGISGVTALTNGNYVVNSNLWNSNTATGAGAVTWGNGNGGTVGPVSASNSLVGTNANDRVGLGGLAPLSNGNYVVGSDEWNDGSTSRVGAATWGDGNGGTVGPVSTGNSLVGTTLNDTVGNGIFPLTGGDYLVGSYNWSNGAMQNAGAATLGDGNGGTVGTVSADNSLVGTATGDQVGLIGIGLSNGDYVVRSPNWHNGGLNNAGAVTLRRGSDRQGATITAENSVLGGVASAGDTLTFDYDATRDQLVVGRPAENIVTVFKADLLFRNGFE